ncbi:MAG: DUF4352 domain-containing protein [Bifidobacteriaceae bacterium]|jgi:hypothetical protein|nr:DUF4352 domain-containing protein [Bifidobacteriaceae bacterium]
MSHALGFHPPQRRLSTRATIGVGVASLLVLVGIVTGAAALTGAFNHPTPTPAPVQEITVPAPGQSGATRWSLGRSFDSGGFSLKIVSYEDGIGALASDGSEISEHGQWVLIQIEVTNNGEKEGTFVPNQQFLITDDGQRFPNEPASALRHKPSPLGTAIIAPGEYQSGYLAFDIPLDRHPTELELVGRVGELPVTVPLG